jgi:uncharacterized protein
MDEFGYRRGIDLFNRAEFFEAHEVLEDVWRAAPVPEKKFLQGLIQIAVAFHHHSTGNLVGARSLLQRALRNLAGHPEDFGGIQLSALLGALAHWRQALEEGGTPPAFPKIREC